MSDIVVTCGDINGIGPEIALKAIRSFSNESNHRFIFIAPRNIIEYYSFKDLNPEIVNSIDLIKEKKFYIFDIGEAKFDLGEPTKQSGSVAYKALIQAIEYVDKNRNNSILVTSPISKFAIKLAGIDMPGHTEILAVYFNTHNYCMMFLSDSWHAALATIHIPIAKVPGQITTVGLEKLIDVILTSTKNDLLLKEPRLALLGLNPHAGEEGKIGDEEEQILKPLVRKYPDTVFGPFVPDAFFAQQLFNEYDVTIGMYHDQILIPFKLLNGKIGVNYTAGLPIVRTSPDHGTAYNITGKNIADAQSMINSIKWGLRILRNRNINNGN